MFQYRRKVKCMLDTVIVTPYHYDSIKFIPVSAENIYDLPSSSMHRNIAISNFQLNFARQILSPHISDPSKKISPSTKQIIGNVKKCAVGKHPKSEKHGNTAQFSEVERSGTQENCGGIGSGCRLRLRPLPVLRRRQSQRVARIDPNAVVVDKNIAENDRFDLFSR